MLALKMSRPRMIAFQKLRISRCDRAAVRSREPAPGKTSVCGSHGEGWRLSRQDVSHS